MQTPFNSSFENHEKHKTSQASCCGLLLTKGEVNNEGVIKLKTPVK